MSVNSEGSVFNKLEKGSNQIICDLHDLKLVPNVYSMRIKLKSRSGYGLGEVELVSFKVQETSKILQPQVGYYREKLKWSIKEK